MPPADLRTTVAAELERLCAPGAALHVDADGATWRRHTVGGTDPHAARYSPDRIRLHRTLIDEFRERDTAVATDGCAAVVTAGPPAAGKSTRLGELGYGPEWRRIDPDVFKLMLIEHDRRSRVFTLPDHVAGLVLADGGGIMPLEASGLYHHESTAVADHAREICMAAHENVVIEGTLSWSEVVPRIVGDLLAHEYQSLDVILVEVPLKTALDQALQRWWPQRQAGGLGGRFTPAATIRSMYWAGSRTVCADNARDLVEKAQAANLRSELKS